MSTQCRRGKIGPQGSTPAPASHVIAPLTPFPRVQFRAGAWQYRLRPQETGALPRPGGGRHVARRARHGRITSSPVPAPRRTTRPPGPPPSHSSLPRRKRSGGPHRASDVDVPNPINCSTTGKLQVPTTEVPSDQSRSRSSLLVAPLCLIRFNSETDTWKRH